MNLGDLFRIDLDDQSATNREVCLKVLAVILRTVAVLMILSVIAHKWVA